MKRMIVSLLVLSLAAGVKAQEIPNRKDDGDRSHNMQRGMNRHRDMLKELNLTDAQKEQFKTQRESMRKQMEELKKNDNITVKEWRSKMEAMRKDNREKMQNILTADQKARVQQLKKEQQGRRQEKMRGMQDRMKSRLGLTDEQSAKLDKNRKDMMEKMKTIREDKSLSEDQKKEQLKALHEQQKSNLKSILTEEQLKKMKESRGGDRRHRDERKGDPAKKQVI